MSPKTKTTATTDAAAPAKAKRKKQPAYKHVNQSGTVSSIDDAFSEIEGLGEEMREQYDNLSDGNLSATSKCEMAGEAADTLEGVSSVEAPSCIADSVITYSEMVNARKGRALSRAVRLSNAVSVLQGAADEAQNALDAARELQTAYTDAQEERDAATDEDEDGAQNEVDAAEAALTLTDDECDEVEQFINDLESAIRECENVEFPGMYG